MPDPPKDWVEAEFNPASLELARMSKLLEEADRYMIQVKCGSEQYMRVSYSILTQILDYFYFILADGHKRKMDTLKRECNTLITFIERKNMNAQRRGREAPIGSNAEAEAIDKLVELQSMIYHLKGILGLGIVFKKRMSSEDILDSALGIDKLDKDVEEIDKDYSEEEMGDLTEEEKEALEDKKEEDQTERAIREAKESEKEMEEDFEPEYEKDKVVL